MIRRRTALLAAIGLLAPAALISSAAGAIDQDLVVSATAGPPGTEITVSSASCVSTDDVDAYLEVALISGTAPNEQLAGIGQGFEGSATVTVPDWVDPDQPAVLEASCDSYDNQTDDEQTLDYDPVAFDVEAGSGTPVQVRTLSRTELLAGQGFLTNGSCGTGYGDALAVSVVFSGTDQSGRDFAGYAGEGISSTDSDGAFELPTIVSNATVGISVSFTNDVVDQIETDEEPMDLPPGDYTVFTYCSGESDSLLFLQPSPLTITGAAPTDGADLLNTEGTNEITMAGECAAGEVDGFLEGISTDQFASFDPATASDAALRSGRRALLGERPSEDGRITVRAGEHLATASGRAIPDDDGIEFAATPDGAGAWSHADTTTFDQGAVIGQASCGDPFADGYAYDPQAVAVDVAEVPVTVPATVPTTVAPAPPASVVSGVPDYAG